MTLDDTQKIVLDAYRSAVGRLRWIVLASITLSSVLIGHMYTEAGFTVTQLLQVALRKELGYSPSSYDHEAAKAKLSGMIREHNKNPAVDLPTADTLAEFAEDALAIKAGDNMYDKFAWTEKTVPLLNFPVFWNDFAIVVGLILAVLGGAVWLNAKSIDAALDSLIPAAADPNCGEFKRLARLFFLFTPGGARDLWPLVIQYGAVWLPPVTMAVALFMDMGPALHMIIKNNQFPAPAGAVVWRTFHYVILIGLMVLTAERTTAEFRRIDGRL